MVPLQAAVLVLAALAAVAVVLARDPRRQLVLNGVYGLVLCALFVVLQAPDAALSILVVSTVAYPVVVLAAVAKVRARARSDEEGEG